MKSDLADAMAECERGGCGDCDYCKAMQRTRDNTVERSDEAEARIVDLIKRLIDAGRDATPHLSHEDSYQCAGCQAIREGLNFVHLMTTDER